MLEKIIENTKEYISSMPKKERKKYGQFFTSKSIAEYMAGSFCIPEDKKEISILDAGAGTGILSCALLERLEEYEHIEKIDLTCYEIDEDVLEVLQLNLLYCKEKSKKIVEINIVKKNYITSQELEFNNMIEREKTPAKYDLVIGNPPYKKIRKAAPEAQAMLSVCYGAPNLYSLFAAMGLFNLKDEGEMVYIVPRSWTSGVYFKKFREYFLSKGKLEQIHLFVSRDKIFDNEDVLQETMIIKVKKTQQIPETVTITSSNTSNDFNNITSLEVNYNLVVSEKDKYVYLVTNEDEVNILNQINKWNHTLPDMGLKMRTGLTVDFRNREFLRNEREEGSIPLFYSQHIKEGKITFPIEKDNEYLVTEKNGLLQENKNYLFVKRFTSKEENRRLQCGIYLAKNYPEYEQISTQNKINFIESFIVEMSECLVYGLYVLFNSTLYDKYYRILNGSTQVNATEINNMPVPDIGCIQKMGRKLMRSKDLSESNCDDILEEYCG